MCFTGGMDDPFAQNRRKFDDAAKMPARIEVLREIADTIVDEFPLQANWLRNMAADMDFTVTPAQAGEVSIGMIAGTSGFDRRQRPHG